MSGMMAPPKMDVLADSGYGAKISAFRKPRVQYAGQLQVARALNMDLITAISQFEHEHVVSMAFATSEARSINNTDQKVATFSKEAHTFFLELDTFLKRTRAVLVSHMALSESLGSMTLTIVYREAPRQEKPVD